MSKRLPTTSTAPAGKAMAVPVRAASPKTPAAAVKPNAGSSARKPKSTKPNSAKPAMRPVSVTRGLSLLIPFVIFLSFGLFLIWERVKVNELAADIEKLKAQRTQLHDQNGKLFIELEQLSGYGRISRLASQRLGLVAVPQQTIFFQEK